MPVRVEVDLPARPAPAIEGIAYFTVSELLQDVSKHSGARTASVDVWRSEDRLMLQVSDDGVGGAGVSAVPGWPVWPRVWTRWTGSWSWTPRGRPHPGDRGTALARLGSRPATPA